MDDRADASDDEEESWFGIIILFFDLKIANHLLFCEGAITDQLSTSRAGFES